MGLYLAHRHATGVPRDDFVVEAGPAGLVLGDELGLEAAVTVARHLDGQLAEIALEGLLALAVAGVASRVGHSLVAFMAQVLSQLSVQSSLDQQLGQLLEQAVLADEVFRLLVVSQQARQQFFGYVVFLGAHCAYGQAGLRRRWIVRLHKILHTLDSGQHHGRRPWSLEGVDRGARRSA
ncbi:hypothetical protein SDC9_154171 [bioreactor metagenome]|uniref:Uncharacterized protein n=1 Tax=bioreactor metagenome TaxID=1076179 RepID=A0A645F2U6_9ZZZZ